MARESDRRTHIVRTAARVFMEHGYEATSMNRIARRAEVSKPGLYYHFKSKQELLFAIVSRAMDFLENATGEACRDAHDSESLLRQILYRQALMTSGEEDGAFSLLVVDLPDVLPPEETRFIGDRKRAHFEKVRSLLEQLRQEGKLRDLDVTVSAFSLLGMVMWISKWFRPDGRLTGEEAAAQVTELALSAVLRDDRRESEVRAAG